VLARIRCDERQRGIVTTTLATRQFRRPKPLSTMGSRDGNLRTSISATADRRGYHLYHESLYDRRHRTSALARKVNSMVPTMPDSYRPSTRRCCVEVALLPNRVGVHNGVDHKSDMAVSVANRVVLGEPVALDKLSILGACVVPLTGKNLNLTR